MIAILHRLTRHFAIGLVLGSSDDPPPIDDDDDDFDEDEDEEVSLDRV